MYIYAQLHWVPKIMTLTFDLDPIYNLGYDTLIKYLLSHVFKLFVRVVFFEIVKSCDKLHVHLCTASLST